jgi:hypothetical protein
MGTPRSFKVRKCAVFCAGALVALALLPAPATAGTFSFVTPAGATTSGGPVSARADITTTGGQISITLSNLQANPTDVAQLLSDFHFTVGVPGNLAASIPAGASAQSIFVIAGGTTNPGGSLTTVAAVGWVYTTTSSTDGTLDVLQGPGHAGPANLIIGPPGPGGTYSNANGSIAGNGPHNPFLDQSASFTITAPGIFSFITITGVTFSFGTTEGANEITGVPLVAATPEPGSLALLATATGSLAGYFGWRRRKQIQAP